MTDKAFKKLLDESLKPLQEGLGEMRQELGTLRQDTESGFSEVKDTQKIHAEKLDALWDQTEELTVDMTEVKEMIGGMESRASQRDRHLDLTGDKVIDHEQRLKDIESVPVVAHELRLKKTKGQVK